MSHNTSPLQRLPWLIAAALLAVSCASQSPAFIESTQEKGGDSPADTATNQPKAADEVADVVTAAQAEEAVTTAQIAVARAEDDAQFEAAPAAALESLTETFNPDSHSLLKEVRPSRDSKGCASIEDFRDYHRARRANNKFYSSQAAEKNGWRRVANLRFEGHRSSAAPPGLDPLPKGTKWLLVHKMASCGELPEIYIDADHNTFVIYPENDCARAVELKVCGTMAVAGCGRKPGTTLMYALVPDDAKAVPSRSVKLPERRCYVPKPTNGFSRPG